MRSIESLPGAYIISGQCSHMYASLVTVKEKKREENCKHIKREKVRGKRKRERERERERKTTATIVLVASMRRVKGVGGTDV